jgi:hypothetical protein
MTDLTAPIFFYHFRGEAGGTVLSPYGAAMPSSLLRARFFKRGKTPFGVAEWSDNVYDDEIRSAVPFRWAG